MRLLIRQLPVSIRLLLAGFLFLMALFSAWRLIFLLSLLGTLQFSDTLLYLQAFWVGLRLDAVVSCYFLLPLLPFALVLSAVTSPILWFRKIQSVYLGLVSFIISGLSLADIFFYHEFGHHLNWLMIQPQLHAHENREYILAEYHPGLFLFLVLLITAISLSIYLRRTRPREPLQPSLTLKIGSVVTTIILLGLLIRGGWQERPIDWGHAMFSADNTANQIALNGLFIFGRSVIEFNSERDIDQALATVSEATAFEITRQILAEPHAPFINDHSLQRIPPNKPFTPLNVFLVILESHTARYCGHLHERGARITPHLDSLAARGLAFTRCYANGKRSAHGISSILMSWPTLPGLPLLSQITATGQAPSLARTLENNSYKTVFLYGGDAQFDNMEGFARANGFESVIQENDLPAGLDGTMWGVYDHQLIPTILELADSADRPLFLTWFTTTNHQPWEVPASYASRIPDFPVDHYHKGQVQRTMHYVDLVIGELMTEASQRDWFGNSLFIFTADHGLSIYRDRQFDLRNGHIPLVFYAPGLDSLRGRFDFPVSQADIAPTILNLIGNKQPFLSFGHDLINSRTGTVCRVHSDVFQWLEGNLLYTELFDQQAILEEMDDLYSLPYRPIPPNDPRVARSKERAHAYLGSAFLQFKRLGRSD